MASLNETDMQKIMNLIRETIKSSVKEECELLEKKLESTVENSVKSAVSNAMAAMEERFAVLNTQTRDNTAAIINHDVVLDEIQSKTLPAVQDQAKNMITAMGMRLLEDQMHKRKWSLIVTGIQGQRGENEWDTRNNMIEFAHNELEIHNAHLTNFSACHRLKQSDNAPVIIKFNDLAQKDTWLRKAYLLKRAKKSVIQDVPPTIRDLRQNVYEQKKALSPDQQQEQWAIKYHQAWPFVEMKSKSGASIKPKFTKAEVVDKFMALENL